LEENKPIENPIPKPKTPIKSVLQKSWAFVLRFLWYKSVVIRVLLVLILLLVLALQSVYVQTYLAHLATVELSKALNFPITVQLLEIQWLDQIKLKTVQIKDRQNHNMIFVEELTLNYNFRKLLQDGHIVVEHAEVDSANVNMIQYADSLGGMNLDAFIEAIDDSPADTTKKTSAGSQFIVQQIDLKRSFFSFHEPTADSIKTAGFPNRFDHKHFAFNNLQATVKNFVLVRDTIQLDIKNLQGIEPTIKFPIKEITTFFRYCRKGLEFRGLTARLGNSILRDTILFHYNRAKDLSDFNHKVKIYANLKNSLIDFKDLAIFAPSLQQYPEFLQISGKLNGKVTKFKIDSLDARFGKNSHLIGKISIEGFPDLDETFMNFNLKKSRVNMADLRIYLRDEGAFRRVNKFGVVNFNSQFTGFAYDFVTHGQFHTALGYIDADINIKTENNYYKGALITKNFDLGVFLNESELVQQIDMNGTIEGNNYTTNDAHFNINAKVSRFGFKGYDYKQISVNAHLEHKFFKGDLAVKDSNFMLSGNGSINLKDSTINFRAKLDTAFIHKINLSKEYLFLKGEGNLNFKGLDLDRLVGEIDIKNAFVNYKEEQLPIKQLYISSKILPNKVRDFDFESDYVNFMADGKFDLKQVYNDIKDLAKEYQLHFENNADRLVEYYSKKLPKTISEYNALAYTVKYKLNLKDISPVAKLFVKDFYVSQNATFTGMFLSDYKKFFHINGDFDTLIYNDLKFYQTSLDLTTYKEEDSQEVHLSTNITSEKQKISIFDTELMQINAEWHDHKIGFNTYIKKQESGDNAAIAGSFDFVGNREYELLVNPSKFTFLSQNWENPDTLHIAIKEQEINFNSIRLLNGHQKVFVIGEISENVRKTLQVQLVDFDLDLFSPFVGKKLRGSISGEAIMRNLYHTPAIEGEISASHIFMDSVYIGDMHATSAWDGNEQRVAIKAKLKQQPDVAKHYYKTQHLLAPEADTVPILAIDGYYYSAEEKAKSPLDLTARFRVTPMKFIEPFLSSITSDFQGLATGDIAITGTPAYPKLHGELFVADGKFKVNYLNTHYKFNDFVYFEADKIGMKSLKLLDDNSNRAIVNGGILHNSFRDFKLDIHLAYHKFKVLDTQLSDEALYFGTAYGSGTMDILGETSNLQIDIDGKTESGTKIYLALDGYAGVEEKEFIKFVDFQKDSLVSKQADKVDLSGIKMNFNLELTPEAAGEIIFDKASGDIIRGNTQGKLNMSIDTKGEFSMFGDVEFVKGSYTFTFLNVVNKEFEILRGSRVNWSGDPYSGQLDVRAAYKTRTSLAPIITVADSATQKSAEIRRPYPVRVDLGVKGALLSPEIKFDIDILEYPAIINTGNTSIPLETYVQAFKARVNSNEQELNRQVFSLMLLNRLSEQDAFSGIGGQSITSSVSELLTNQLSHWASQVDENLQIDMNLNGLTADALNTFQMRVSYALFGGRVQITRSGGFTSVNNRASATAVIGDWTVEYLITKDARFRAKAYYKSVSNTFNTNLNNVGASGVGLSYTRSFNRFGELLPRLRKAKKQKKNDKIIIVPDDEIR
jgi:hypothetical protein